jgi:hypothetical protein
MPPSLLREILGDVFEDSLLDGVLCHCLDFDEGS